MKIQKILTIHQFHMCELGIWSKKIWKMPKGLKPPCLECVFHITQTIYTLCAVVTTGNEMNKGNKVDIDLAAKETMNKFNLSRGSPKVKTIVVHPELYQALVMGKGMLTMDWAQLGQRPEGASSVPTFADVIVEWHNRGNHFAQLMSRIIRQHPELKPIIEEVAKQDPEHYRLVEAMLETIGKPK